MVASLYAYAGCISDKGGRNPYIHTQKGVPFRERRVCIDSIQHVRSGMRHDFLPAEETAGSSGLPYAKHTADFNEGQFLSPVVVELLLLLTQAFGPASAMCLGMSG